MAIPILDESTAVIAVDVQNCFCPGGSLAVPQGDEIVPLLNAYMEKVATAGGRTFASRDWHPEDHSSFREQGGPWPVHCVRGTKGAEFHPDLLLPPGTEIISKAMEPDAEAYSAFDNTGLAEKLRWADIRRVLVGGLATDYCVRHTVIDALKEGFETWLLLDAIRAVDVNPGDGERAIEEMLAAGARPLRLKDLG